MLGLHLLFWTGPHICPERPCSICLHPWIFARPHRLPSHQHRYINHCQSKGILMLLSLARPHAATVSLSLSLGDDLSECDAPTQRSCDLAPWSNRQVPLFDMGGGGGFGVVAATSSPTLPLTVRGNKSPLSCSIIYDFKYAILLHINI